MDNKQLLANLLEHPEMVGPAHVPMLQELLKEYPYAQPIHILLAKADVNFVPKASLYSNSTALYNILQKNYTANASFNEVEVIDDLPYNSKTDSSVEKSLDESLIIESAMATDFFTFEQSFSTEIVAPYPPEIETVIPEGVDGNIVSKYDDDQLPYTFLWWLAKTRKEHAQIFQPYARPAQNTPQQNNQNTDFQQQYVEHIFHIQTPFEVADHLAEYTPTDVKDVKGAEIIERFLKEDPTIKAPKPEQIDNENKAKKSAEDHYDLVSETLAKIYIEQMLYHKAIDTYKKLSLKYPEKSRYFADLIQSIEKKF